MQTNLLCLGWVLSGAASLTYISPALAQELLPPETIELNLLTDESSIGEATLSGLIRLGATDSRTFTATGDNWLFTVIVNTENILDGPFYFLEAEAQYLGGVPDLLLDTPRQNIDDASVVDGPSAGREIETVEFTEGNTSVQLISTLIDVNPERPGFGEPTGIDGDFARTISAQFTTTRTIVPEASTTTALMAMGGLFLAGTALRRSQVK